MGRVQVGEGIGCMGCVPAGRQVDTEPTAVHSKTQPKKSHTHTNKIKIKIFICPTRYVFAIVWF